MYVLLFMDLNNLKKEKKNRIKLVGYHVIDQKFLNKTQLQVFNMHILINQKIIQQDIRVPFFFCCKQNNCIQSCLVFQKQHASESAEEK